MPEAALFGRYWAAESPIHALDPRTKLLGMFAFMAIVFCAQTFAGLGVCALFCGAFFVAAQIPLHKAFKSIAPLLFIVVITALLNVFWVQGGTVYVSWGWLQISETGVRNAVFLSCRLVLLLGIASLMTLTTTTLDTTDAFERLLAPLRRVGFPAHEFAMIMGIALRFLPQFITEIQTIYRAQLSRGANLSTSPIKGGVRMLTSLLVPLFTSAFRHAETLSSGMEARCYHGEEGRTHLNPLRFGRGDIWAVPVLAVCLAGVLALNFVGI